MLKASVDKADYDSLEETVRSLYRQSGDRWVLDVTGVESHPDVTALKRTLDDAVAEKRKLQGSYEEQISEYKKKLEGTEEEQRKHMESEGKYRELYEKEREARSQSDSEWRSKYERLEAQNDEKERVSAAKDLANKLAGANAEGLLPHIEKRLKMFEQDGHRVLKVVDDVGNATALSMDDLANELRGVSYLKNLMLGPGSSGGGAGPTRDNGSGAGEFDKFFDPKSPDYNATEQGKLLKSDPEQFAKMQAKYANA